MNYFDSEGALGSEEIEALDNDAISALGSEEIETLWPKSTVHMCVEQSMKNVKLWFVLKT